VDAAPTGEAPSLGDAFVLSENLFRDGKKAGISGVVVVRDVSEIESDITRFISDLG
jgi:hypothetical protein